jgi:hypothetical protein
VSRRGASFRHSARTLSTWSPRDPLCSRFLIRYILI